MNNEILDNGFENGDKRKGIQIVNWISIIILWVGIGYCGTSGLLSEIKVIAAIVLLLLSTATMYFNYELGVKITLGTILIGIINLADFFPSETFIYFETNAIKIEFEAEPKLFGIGIIHYFTNREVLSKFLKDLLNIELSEEEIKSVQHSRINGFKRRFEKLSDKEIELRLHENLVPTAIEALKQIKRERENILQ